MIIGEAIKNIPQSFHDQYPAIDWRNIGRLRDIIVHRYFGLNTKTVWEIVQKDAPELLQELEAFPEATFIPTDAGNIDHE